MDESLPPVRPLVVRALVVSALFVLVPLVAVWAVPEVQDPLALQAYLARFGPLAPLAFVLFQVVQVIVAPIPAWALAVAGGYLFGAVPGAVYSVVGTVLGSTIVIVLARRFGRDYVDRLVGTERMHRFDGLIDRAGLPGVFILLLLPGPWPDDAICFVAGVSRIPVRLLVGAVLLGRGPSLVVFSFLGADILGSDYTMAALVAVSLCVAWVVGYYYRRRLFDVLHGLFGGESGL